MATNSVEIGGRRWSPPTCKGQLPVTSVLPQHLTNQISISCQRPTNQIQSRQTCSCPNQLIFKGPLQPNLWFCVSPTPAGNCLFNTTQELSVKCREESSSPGQLSSAFLSNFHSQLLHENVLQSYLFLSCPVESLWISHVSKTNYFKLKSSKIYLSKF